MCDIIKTAIGPFLGAAFGCGFGIIGFWLQRRWVARDAFHLVVEEQIAKFQVITRASDPAKPSLSSKTEDDFVRESIPLLIAASRRVRRHIGENDRRSLDAAMEDYLAYHTKYQAITGRCLISLEGGQDFVEAIKTKLVKSDECVTDNPVA